MADVDAFCPQPITVSAILSYCGSSLDLAINYSLLVINLLGGTLQRRSRSISTMNGSSSSSACTHRPPSLGSALLSLAFGEYSSGIWRANDLLQMKTNVLRIRNMWEIGRRGRMRARKQNRRRRRYIRVLIIITSIYPFIGPPFDHPCSHRLSDHSLPICWLCWDINYLVCNIGVGGGGVRRHFQR